MNTIWHDMRFGLRQLCKSPGFTAVAVLSLALGIGANTAIFGFLDRILLRPLPVKEPHELVMVKHRLRRGGTGNVFSYPSYRDLRDQSEEIFSGLIAHGSGGVKLSVGDLERKAFAVYVSNDYFSVLGVKPVLGRDFLAGEDQAPSGHPVAIISHELWQRQFQGDPGVLGKTIRVNDYPLTVVGVAPPGFTGIHAGVGPSVYMPLKMWANIWDMPFEKPFLTWLFLLGRLKPGMSHRQAEAALRVVAERLHAIQPVKPNFPTEMLVADGSRGMRASGSLRRTFALLQVVTALLLLVACVNIANMLLARGMARQKEIAIRRAMGAGRGGIVRQLLTESALLAILSGACGVLLAHWLSMALRSALTEASALNTPVGVDGRILVFATLGSLSSILIFGLIPALHVSRTDPIAAIKDDAGAVMMLGRRRNLRNCLLVMQIAVSVVSLTFGGLCIRGLLKLRFGDPGFDHSRVLGVSVNFEHGGAQVPDPQQLFSDLKERVAAYPGVQSVSLAENVPLTTLGRRNMIGVEQIEDFHMPLAPDLVGSWMYSYVGPGYFQTLGVPLLRGRNFSVQDGPGTTKVMIVNELLAQRFWPNQDPIGKRVTFQGSEVREVVGLVKTAKLQSIQQEPVPRMFWPIAQQMGSGQARAAQGVKPILLVRTTGNLKALISLIRSELDSADLNPGVYTICPIARQVWDLLIEQRMTAGILNIVACVGLLFVAMGIFSVMAFEMGRRTREIGIRMALGAQQADVRKLILRKGAFLAGIGLVLGIGFSFVSLRFMIHLLPDIRGRYGDLLYGVHIWDPLTYAGVALLVGLVALSACWLPAHRATKVDPMEALRYE